MKVYVDELPKNCYDCPCMDYHEGVCQVTNQSLCFNYGENHCPLQSLSDYTKQVRKEVCEEIKDLAGNYFELPYCDNCGETLFALSDVVLTGSDLTEILDQIQGEKCE